MATDKNPQDAGKKVQSAFRDKGASKGEREIRVAEAISRPDSRRNRSEPGAKSGPRKKKQRRPAQSSPQKRSEAYRVTPGFRQTEPSQARSAVECGGLPPLCGGRSLLRVARRHRRCRQAGPSTKRWQATAVHDVLAGIVL